MNYPLTTILLFFSGVLFILFACSPSQPKKDSSLLINIQDKPSEIIVRNNHSVNNKGGHIQGVQFYHSDQGSFYFFSGSSNHESYYAIANADTKEIISVNDFLVDPFRHAGGFQVAEDLLAVGIEDNLEKDKSKVLLFRIIDPQKPDLQLLKTIDRQGNYKHYTAGCVAITKLDDQILLAVGNWDTKNIDFYKIPQRELDNSAVNFEFVYSLNSDEMDRQNWVEKGWYSYQNINFFTSRDNKLYLAGMALNELAEKDVIDIFGFSSPESNSFKLQKIQHQTLKKPSSTTFKWGGGVYLDEQQRLNILSCGEHIEEYIAVNMYAAN